MTFPSPNEQVKFWRSLSNMEVLRATYVTHAFARHTHEEYAIGVIESGVESFDYRGCTYQAPAGSVVIIHPGEVHTGQAGTPHGWQYRMFYPDTKLVRDAIAQGIDEELQSSWLAHTLPFFPEPVISDPEIANGLRHLHSLSEQGEDQLSQDSYWLWLWRQLIHRYAVSCRSAPSTGRDAIAIRRVQAYLMAHYALPCTLEDLAQVAQLKPLRLLRSFQSLVGLPPHVYLVQIRINQAKRLLQAGRAIAEVATDTGFTDQSHLHRHFKRRVGVTPRQYALGYR